MDPRFWLLLGILAELGVFVVVAVDSDGFNAVQLLDLAHFHHEWFELILAVASTVFYIAYGRGSIRGRSPSGEPTYAA